MPLEFPAEWRFSSPGIAISGPALRDFFDLAVKIASVDDDPQITLEEFKGKFGNNSWSSNSSWAETDLRSTMDSAAENAPLFVESFVGALEALSGRGIPVPDIGVVNGILRKHDVPLEVDLPYLHHLAGDAVISETSSGDGGTSHAIPTYQRHELIGSGSFGEVYRVTRTTSMGEFEFAMKVFFPSRFIAKIDVARDRFTREVQVLRRLQHRAIIQHLEAGLDSDDRPYLLMPLIQGVDIRDHTEGWEPVRVVTLFRQVLEALAYAHAQGVIHRDLKPNNILVRASDEQVIILDFGCAYVLDDAEEASLTTSFIGTGAYAPTEVFRSPRLRTPKQDIYSCGVLLFELVERSLPDHDEPIALTVEFPERELLEKLLTDATAPVRHRLEDMSEFIARVDAIIR